MSSPVLNRINTIFIHVSNLKRSVEWYSRLLGQHVDLSNVEDPIYNIEMNQYTGLTLDSGPKNMKKQIHPSDYPLLNFHTDDLDRAYQYVQKLGFVIVEDKTYFKDLAYFTIKDPDGHIIMICNC